MHPPRHAASMLTCLGLFISAAVPAARCHAQASQPAQPGPAAPTLVGTAKLRADAQALRPLVQSPLAHAFFDAVPCLPDHAPRTVYFDTGAKRWMSRAEADALDATARATLKERTVDFYETKYGSPLAYARPFEILATSRLDPAVSAWAGVRVLDFGYGTIGHLTMLSACGAAATGVDVDSMLPALYSDPDDLKLPPGSACRNPGTVTLVDGQFPAGPGVAERIGRGYDLFISKNTLKRGYVHPERPADPRTLVHLGIPDEGFLHALFATLKPGGVVLIYNLCPAPAPEDKPYIPWADGRCPFPRELWEKAGFRVVAFDEKDDGPARAMARALGWDKSGMNVDTDLFAWYSLFQKPRE